MMLEARHGVIADRVEYPARNRELSDVAILAMYLVWRALALSGWHLEAVELDSPAVHSVLQLVEDLGLLLVVKVKVVRLLETEMPLRVGDREILDGLGLSDLIRLSKRKQNRTNRVGAFR